jgi:putative endonuclease
MYYVYIIECLDGSLYTGYTTNVARRYKEHTEGTGSKYTRSHRPKKLVYTERFSTLSLAMKREAEIKSWARDKKCALLRT